MRTFNINQRQYFNRLYEKSKKESDSKNKSSDDFDLDNFKNTNHEFLSDCHLRNLYDEIVDLVNIFKFECFLHKKLFKIKPELVDDPS